jgi:antirestriction protein ArdC
VAKTSRRLTEAERAERRARDRDRLQHATEALLSSNGWRRWVKARATFHSYSLSNTLLLAHQCAARGITPTRVAGFRAWLRLNRCVRRGEAALWVIAPVPVKQRDHDSEESGEKRVFFRSVPVFELSQTEQLPGTDPVPLEPPSAPVTGDSHAHLLDPLAELASEIGFSFEFAELDGSCGGFCDYRAKRIVVEDQQAPNAKVRVAVHELAHALGGSSARFGRERAEVIVETAAYIACAGVGLATDTASIPYIAGWGEDGALDAVTEAATVIDEIAARIEDALGLRAATAQSDATPDTVGLGG